MELNHSWHYHRSFIYAHDLKPRPMFRSGLFVRKPRLGSKSFARFMNSISKWRDQAPVTHRVAEPSEHVDLVKSGKGSVIKHSLRVPSVSGKIL
jgi:hypothetical protein